MSGPAPDDEPKWVAANFKQEDGSMYSDRVPWFTPLGDRFWGGQIGVVDIVLGLRHALGAAPPRGDGWLAARGLGGAYVLPDDAPHTFVMGAARIASGVASRLRAHVLRPGAVNLIRETDVPVVPASTPSLLERNWIIEASNPARSYLFGTTYSIAGLPCKDGILVLGMGRPYSADGVPRISAGLWAPRWDGESLDASIELGLDRDDAISPLADRKAVRDALHGAVRFAIACALVLESEGAPLRVLVDRPAPGDGAKRKSKKKKGFRKGRSPAPWAIHNVYLDEQAIRRAQLASSAMDDDTAPPEGKRWELVAVRGHVKRQHHGPGNSLTKWIYVPPHRGRRLVCDRPVKVFVGRRPDGAEAARQPDPAGQPRPGRRPEEIVGRKS